MNCELVTEDSHHTVRRGGEEEDGGDEEHCDEARPTTHRACVCVWKTLGMWALLEFCSLYFLLYPYFSVRIYFMDLKK